MERNEKKPEIRFKGFCDDWEWHKFEDIAQRISNTGISSEEAPSVEYEDVVSEQGVLNKDIRQKETTKTGIKFSGEEVLYGKLRPYLHNWLNPDFNGIAVGDWWVLKPVGFDKNFLYGLIQTPEFDDMANQSSGTKMPRADWKLISGTEFCIPADLGEQEKIGVYFSNLDNLIIFQQHKYDQLLKVKKSMLKKMFPQNGEKTPEIRFAGFTDDWEQHKLGELFEEYSEKNHEECPPLTVIQGSGTIRRDESDRNLQFDKASLSNYKMVRKDDFIVHLRSFEGGLERASITGIVSPAYHILHGERTDSRFYYAYFRSHYFINVQLKPHVYGVRDGRSVDIEGMKTINIPFPSTAEQHKIGDLISNIDHLITLHQHKLESLKKIKKVMLEKMFV